MMRLTKALKAWGTSEFNEVFAAEIEQLDVEHIPLQRGLTTGSVAVDNKLKVMIINVSDESSILHVKAGIFYSGIIAGCSCADDPTPMNESNEYCVVQIDIDKNTAQATTTLLFE